MNVEQSGSGSRSNTSDELQGKYAIVTGAGKGIGRACAQLLSEHGAKVIAVARTQADLDSLAAETDNRVEAWCEDAASDSLLKRIEAMDRLDILVNNAGTNRPQPFVDVDDDALDALLDLNLRAAFRVTRAAARVMLKHKRGSIVHISSQMGHVGAVNRSVYCMTKHGIEGLMKASAVELAGDGIRVNSVAPTFIETPMTRPMLDDPEFNADVLSRIPIGKLGQVEDVANAVLFLASERAAMITGSCLKVDGGWTAQ